MSHFDPRIINSNPKSISGTPILVGLGLVFLIILLWASVAYVPPGNVGARAADYFNANNAFTCALIVTVCGVNSAIGGGVAAGAAERAML